MKIDNKQLIEQLRFLAEHEPNRLKEILDEVLKDKTTLMESNVDYLSSDEHQRKMMINKFREENFKRFDKVYKALS